MAKTAGKPSIWIWQKFRYGAYQQSVYIMGGGGMPQGINAGPNLTPQGNIVVNGPK